MRVFYRIPSLTPPLSAYRQGKPPGRDAQGHQIAALLRCICGGEQTGPVAGLLSGGSKKCVKSQPPTQHTPSPPHAGFLLSGEQQWHCNS